MSKVCTQEQSGIQTASTGCRITLSPVQCSANNADTAWDGGAEYLREQTTVPNHWARAYLNTSLFRAGRWMKVARTFSGWGVDGIHFVPPLIIQCCSWQQLETWLGTTDKDRTEEREEDTADQKATHP